MVLSAFVGSVSLVGVAAASSAQRDASVVKFTRNEYNASRGDIAEIDVATPGVSTAYVTINSKKAGYNPTVRITDGNLDGRVTLLLNTYDTPDGAGRSFGVASTADSVRFVGGDASTPEPLPIGTYSLAVRARQGGEVVDTATLKVTYGGPQTFGMLTAPGRYDRGDFTTVGEIWNRSIATHDVARGDLAIARLGGSGLAGAIIGNQQRGESIEKAFMDFLNAREGNTDVALLTIRDSRTGSAIPITEDNINVVLAPRNGAVFFVFDTDDLKTGRQYNVRFAVSSASEIVDRTVGVSTVIQLHPRRAEFNTQTRNGEEMAVTYADAGASLSGKTTLAPGSKLRVTARGNGKTYTNQTVVVGEGRTWGATFDLTGVKPGTTFTATVSGAGIEQRSVPVYVKKGRIASVEFTDQSTNGSVVTVERVNMSAGGFVVVHDTSFKNGEPIESVRGVSKYLRPGVHKNVEIKLDRPFEKGSDAIAMAHLDTNGNEKFDYVESGGEQDVPYVVDGDAVYSTATLSVGGSGGSATFGYGPGFGPVAALAAIVALGLFALRRE
ncbi:DUF7282 domain-containing protein [Halomarina pelagica]|uniref:DUF7282 domain-containing protein n=1 Tax=Halomarina pelagica TaxID=2961599 RepID=UPI0020C49E68|nr:BGTF surface domain-containing protein [Halomarina sp. BND7]